MGTCDSLKKVASNVMKQFGGDVTVRYRHWRSTPQPGDLTTTESDTTVKGILQCAREVNELVQAGDKRLTVAADDLATAPETKGSRRYWGRCSSDHPCGDNGAGQHCDHS